MSGTVLHNNLSSSLIKYWSPLPEVWPTIEYLSDAISKSAEYKSYCEWRTENPQLERDNLRVLNNEQILSKLVDTVTSTIIHRWIDSQNMILDVFILIKNYNHVTKETNYNLDDLLETYFKHVEQKWVDKLYYKGGIYDLKTLDEMIPHCDSNLFCRQRIMVRYMEQMNKLKPRGEEWEMIILSLWEEIERETNEAREE